MKIIRTCREMQAYSHELKLKGENIGFVPTMGALHAGHLELVKRAKSENDVVVVSIFLNATQFHNQQDFEKYPRTLEKDSSLLFDMGVDVLFLPTHEELYPDDYKYRVQELDLSQELCGKYRPGHFEGVLTVVLKLLNLTQPTRAYFGEKDFQQLKLIEGMVSSFFLPLGFPLWDLFQAFLLNPPTTRL